MILLFISLPLFAASLCADGWVSPADGQGACSYHGGIVDTCGVKRVGSSSVYTINACPITPSIDWSKIVSEPSEKMWQLSLEQARLEASSDCSNFNFCDYDIISRARRINACSFYPDLDSTYKSYICTVSYRQEKEAVKSLEDTHNTIVSMVGSRYASEIMRNHMLDGYTMCVYRPINVIVTYPDNSRVYYVYSDNKRALVDKLDPDKYDKVTSWISKGDCLNPHSK